MINAVRSFSLQGQRLFRGSDKLKSKSSWGALLLGVLFSLAFCPTSGVFYFGMLMPMSAAETGGYLLPVVFAIATGLLVIIVAWILAYSVAGLGTFYNRMQVFQKWMNKIIVLLFIAVGILLRFYILSVKIIQDMKTIEIFDPAMYCPHPQR